MGRRVVFVWAVVMYMGQMLKDIIRWPRPGPPVQRLQNKWSVEYGMPSTHAMVSSILELFKIIESCWKSESDEIDFFYTRSLNEVFTFIFSKTFKLKYKQKQMQSSLNKLNLLSGCCCYAIFGRYLYA